MPTQEQLLPEAESDNYEAHPEASETVIKLTGIPEVDSLLAQVTDSASREKLSAYVYSNLVAYPKLTTALVKRAVYTVPNSKSAFQYSLTNKDIAWLARSLHGEGGPACSREKASALAWTMFNRFMLNPRHFGTTSFWVFLQGFSQPINPKWRSDGVFCKVGGKYHSSDYCSPKKLQRRESIAFGPIPKKCLGFAEEMAVGTLEQPSQAFIDFASYKGMDKYGTKVGGDNFLTAADDVKRLSDKGKSPMAWLSGKVARINMTTVPAIDVIEPQKKSELISYLTNYVAGGQRALENQIVGKSGVNSTASVNAQKGATHTLQQTANAVQATIAVNNVKVSTVSPDTGVGKDGFQVGSDDTWSKV